MTSLTLRDVTVRGRSGLDVRIEAGRIAAIGVCLPGSAQEIEGHGFALIPGLADHHIHLFATAARASSVPLEGAESLEALGERLRRAVADRRPGEWLRAVACPPLLAEALTRDTLDAWLPDHPARVQDQSGALWLLNTLALKALGGALPDGAERDAAGRLTGRLWRSDTWLRQRLGSTPPSLAALGRTLARLGVTAVTDASATTDAGGAALLADARRVGALPQALTLMSAGELAEPADRVFQVGPVKLVLDERDLPPLEGLIERVAAARSQGRNVAFHCVTAAELGFVLAALGAAGARAGDRIEHGSVIPAEAIAAIKALGVAVVVQPGLIFTRGDRYLRETDPREVTDLHRCATLLHAGIALAFSSDAPYGPLDPWVAIRAAATRMTASGEPFGVQEALDPATALSLYHGQQDWTVPGVRRIEVGRTADLCLLGANLPDIILGGAEPVAATIIRGTVVYSADRRQAPRRGA